MAQRPGSACRRSGCAGIVHGGVCDACGPLRRQRQVDYDQRRGTRQQRGYGSEWQRIRAAFLLAHPLCADCEEQGRTTAANEVHHVVALRNGGTHDEVNLRALCKPCHSTRTMRGE